MKNKRLNFKVIFAIASFLVLMVSYIAFKTLNDLVKDSEAFTKSNTILLNLENIISTLKDAETGQRGYLLTRNEAFLEPFTGSKEKVLGFYDVAKTLMGNNSEQNSNLKTLRILIEDRYKELEERLENDSIKLEKNPLYKTELINKGKIIMDQIRGLIDEMKRIEKQKLSIKNENISDSIRDSIISISIFSLMAFLILILTFRLILKDLKRRNFNEQELAKRANDLDLSNKELEQFAYVASHDLQEPLRKVQAFSNRIASRYENKLDETGQDYINRMQNAASRMQKLINDLLDYSRASRHKGETNKVNILKTIQGIISDYEIIIQEKEAEINIEIPDNFELNGISIQIQQLFQNLISNALKFSKPNEKPIVNIKGKIIETSELPKDLLVYEDKKYCQITVSDNGIGFDEKYLDKIFAIFQRLHGRSEYKGTGIGLALCKKITENHLGQIIAKSKPNEGATFKIILPLLNSEKNDE